MENNFKNIHQDRSSKLPKKSGYTVPEEYFDAVENDFSARLTVENFPISSGFEVPQGYFESLESSILSNIETSKITKVVPFRKKLIRWIPASAAAAILLFISVNLLLTKDIEPSSEEIATWFKNNPTIIPMDQLTVNLDESDLEGSPILDILLEADDLSKYLDENDTYILIEDSDIFPNELN